MLLTKRILVLMMAAVMVLCLAACGGDNSGATTAPSTTAPAATNAPTTAPTEADDGTVTYTVKITDESGNPIAGAMVQLCKDTCMPGAADANGVATFKVAEDDYKVSFLALPAGYTYSTDAQEFYFEKGSYEMTIVLKAAG